MAYKNTYGLAGALATSLPASTGATVVQFDAATTAQLQAVLVSGDWTFVLVGSASTAEVLKVNYSATANFTVARQQDGSQLNAHVVGDPVVFSLTASAVAVEVTPPTQVPTATGLVTVDLTNPLAPAFNVTPPNFTGNGLSFVGTWPNYTVTVTADDTNCCGGSGGGSGSGITSLFGYGIAQVVQSGGTASVTVPAPAFTTSGIVITGVWPALNFAVSSTGSGTVTSVVGGAGVVVSGAVSVTPTVSLSPTGVTAGTYGSLSINAFGQLTSIDPAFNPPSTITGVSPIAVAITGHVAAVSVAAAAEGTVGVVALADSGSPLDPSDHTTAVNPALLASVVNALAGATITGFANWSAEATGLYTNVVSGAPVTLSIAAGTNAVVRGSVTMVDTSTPLTPVAFGIAIFNSSGPTLIQGNRKITQSSQTMEIIIAGPFNSTLALASTAVPSGASVVSSALTVTVY